MILFIHGFLGSSNNWQPCINYLKTIFKEEQYLAIDLPGHTQKNPYSKDNLNHKFTVDYLEQKLEEIDEKVSVVAHSFGLRPMLLLSQQHQNKYIKKLIVEDALPTLSKHSFNFISQILKETPVPFESKFQAKHYFEASAHYNQQMSRFLLSHIRKLADNHFNWQFNPAALLNLLKEAYSLDLTQEWLDFSSPIELIYGENSKIVSSEKLDSFLQLKRIPTHLIKNSAHWIHAEQRKQFCELIKAIITNA